MRTIACTLAMLLFGTAAQAAEAIRMTAPHPNPRLKASYRRFAIASYDGASLWLDGAQLDVYALSRRRVRHTIEANRLDLAYGTVGFNGGFQYPARVTPFVEGRVAAGVLSARGSGAMTFAGMTVTDPSIVTWMVNGGIETGIEVYTWRRTYLSAAIGWVRTTWRGPDVTAMISNPSAGVQTKNLESDSFTFKLGFGI
jgi:hypothetical protein